METMKVVINALSARLGGGQTYLINLLRETRQRDGVEIFLLAPDTFPLLDSGSVHRVKPKWATESILLRTLWEKTMLPALLKRIGGDIFFCPGGLVSISPPKGYKTVTMFRNMIPFDRRVRAQYPLLGMQRVRNRFLEKVLLKSMVQADLVIFISEYAKEVILQRVPRGLKKSVVIPHGINDHFRISPDRPPPRPDWSQNQEYLLYVSILDVYKNQLEIIQGYDRLKQMRNTDEKLVLIGHNDSSYGRKVKQEIARRGLKNDVILTGNIPYSELPRAYFHAKMNIFASRCENCPNILLEAMGAGGPLIVSKEPPMPEFAGGAVVYFDPFSEKDFAVKISSVIDDPVGRRELRRKSRERARMYDWSKTARLTWSSLEDL